MKRDLDLVRAILKQIEGAEAGKRIGGLAIEGHSPAEVGEHVRLLVEAGLVDGEATRMMRGEFYSISIRGLTWRGHDFADASRDDSIWKKAKEKVIKTAGSLTFDLVLELLKAEGKKRLGLSESD